MGARAPGAVPRRGAAGATACGTLPARSPAHREASGEAPRQAEAPRPAEAPRQARALVLRSALAACALLVGAATGPAWADPTFRIEFRDGAIQPLRLEVPARTRFRLELANLGSGAAEFESLELRKEKVIAPGVTTVMVIRTLEPGEYAFFDDFHPGSPPAVLVAREVNPGAAP